MFRNNVLQSLPLRGFVDAYFIISVKINANKFTNMKNAIIHGLSNM
jgi:hypothetical protein